MPGGRRRAGIAHAVLQALRRAPSPRRRLSPAVVQSLFNARRYAAGLRRRAVRVGPFEIPFLEGGAGPPLVLLHGFSDTKDSFVDAARFLTPRFRVILPDLPGFGETVGPPDFDYGLPHVTRVFARLCDVLGLRRVHAGGNSLGGAVAAMFALEHPDRVQSLTLVGAAGLVMPTPSPLQRQLDAGVNPFVITSLEQHEAFLRFVLEVPPPMPWAIRTYLAEAFMARASMNGKVMTDLLRDEIDLTQRLPSIQAPTLVLWGDCDRLIDLSAGRVFHQRIPDATLIILHGVGHCPQYEAPDRTAQLLSRFLADQGGGAIVPDINP